MSLKGYGLADLAGCVFVWNESTERERESQDTDVPLLLLRLFLAGKLLLLELAKNGMPMCVLRAAFARTRL